MPWKTLCGFPPTSSQVTLRLPNGAWRPDTVITDNDGNEMFVLLDQTNEMRSYEAVFGDLEGRRLVCVKRHLIKAFWKDGFYFCTYKPNYDGQMPLVDRDCDRKKVYPFSYLQINPMKGRYFYRVFDIDGELDPPRMRAENPWLGFMAVCCTPIVRCGKWTTQFKKRGKSETTINVDQWKNVVEVGPGNDLLAALCMAYVFDRAQSQPLVTVFGQRDDDIEQPDEDDVSLESHPDMMENEDSQFELTNMPQDKSYKDNVDDNERDHFEIGDHDDEQPPQGYQDGDHYDHDMPPEQARPMDDHSKDGPERNSPAPPEIV